MKAEGNPNLSGFQTAGAPIEGTVCTYLVPLWGAGGTPHRRAGKLALGSDAAKKPFELWADLKAGERDAAEPRRDPDRPHPPELPGRQPGLRDDWGYIWNRTQNDADSTVKGKTGVVPLPGFAADKAATCIGGWQVAVSAFSKHKAEAVKLVRFLSSPEISKTQAIAASHLPVFASVYGDPEVLQANPWFKDALPVVQSARSRPVSPRYTEVSEIIRTNMNAFLAGTRSADAVLADMTQRLGPIFK